MMQSKFGELEDFFKVLVVSFKANDPCIICCQGQSCSFYYGHHSLKPTQAPQPLPVTASWGLTAPVASPVICHRHGLPTAPRYFPGKVVTKVVASPKVETRTGIENLKTSVAERVRDRLSCPFFFGASHCKELKKQLGPEKIEERFAHQRMGIFVG